METTTTTQPAKVLYTARTHTSGGRHHGAAHSSDGRLDIKLSPPGAEGNGTNPEQLFAAGWSACFEGAMETAARRMRVELPDATAIDAEIDLLVNKGEYSLQARLNISLPGLDKDVAQQLIETAHKICPYSKAIQGNVNVELNLIN